MNVSCYTDPLSACTSVVSELWSAVDRARKFHQQVGGTICVLLAVSLTCVEQVAGSVHQDGKQKSDLCFR